MCLLWRFPFREPPGSFWKRAAHRMCLGGPQSSSQRPPWASALGRSFLSPPQLVSIYKVGHMCSSLRAWRRGGMGREEKPQTRGSIPPSAKGRLLLSRSRGEVPHSRAESSSRCPSWPPSFPPLPPASSSHFTSLRVPAPLEICDVFRFANRRSPAGWKREGQGERTRGILQCCLHAPSASYKCPHVGEKLRAAGSEAPSPPHIHREA